MSARPTPVLTGAPARAQLTGPPRWLWAIRAIVSPPPLSTINRYDVARVTLMIGFVIFAAANIVGYFNFGWGEPHITPLALILFTVFVTVSAALQLASHRVGQRR